MPLTERARESLDTIVRVHPTIGDGFLFPAPKKAEKPWSRWHARDLLERAEEAAGIDHLGGGAFHRSEGCGQVDEKTLLQVMTNPNRLLDIDVKPQHEP